MASLQTHRKRGQTTTKHSTDSNDTRKRMSNDTHVRAVNAVAHCAISPDSRLDDRFSASSCVNDDRAVMAVLPERTLPDKSRYLICARMQHSSQFTHQVSSEILPYPTNAQRRLRLQCRAYVQVCVTRARVNNLNIIHDINCSHTEKTTAE
jgi:hypothetical protein